MVRALFRGRLERDRSPFSSTQPLAFRVSAAVMVIATVGIVRAIRCARAAGRREPTLRLPDGAHAPRLLHSWVQ